MNQLQLEPDTSASATGSGSGSRDNKMASARRRGADATARSRRQQPTISGSGSGSNAVKQESLTQDIVARIYREELAKLAAAAEATGNMDELAVYRRELERLSSSTTCCVSGIATESWMESRDCFQSSAKVECLSASPSASIYSDSSSDRPQDLRVIKKETTSTQPDGTATGLEPIRRVGSAFTPVQPRATTAAKPTTPIQPPCCDVTASSPGSVANDASPLKQMQTIANLLLPKHSHQRPLRAVLPPITQVIIATNRLSFICQISAHQLTVTLSVWSGIDYGFFDKRFGDNRGIICI